MINILLGPPGGGKSYEAVAYHVLPALAAGRLVITNLPLNLDAFPPEQRDLIVLLTKTNKVEEKLDLEKAESLFKRFGIAAREQKFNARAFSNIEDYGNPWRHPESGTGPLYVIDECHFCLPRMGTPIPVSEWFSMHRHEQCDVLLMTQSYGKVCKDIIDLVQVCYRVKKGTAFGFSSKYIRKVLDGVRGEVMNENIRTYDKKYFKFYRSHTKSSAAGAEMEASDIVPIWKRWPVIGAVILIPAAIFIMSLAGNPMKSKVQAKKEGVQKPEVVQVTSTATKLVEKEKPATATPETAADKPHPLAGLGLHIAGYLESQSHSMYLFTVSQNGQAVYTMNQQDLLKSGYAVRSMNDCIAEVSFEAVKFYVTCDAPRVGIGAASSVPNVKS